MKLVVVGGGSTYTPELLSGLVVRGAAIGLETVVLSDPDTQRVAPVLGFCQRMAKAGDASFEVVSEPDLETAVSGADFVVIQIRVGGQQGRHEDIQLGLRHGLIGQETTGVGGMAKALRTIPEGLRIAEVVRRKAPQAWILNFTNPAGMVTEALHRSGFTRSIGLCNVPIEMHIDAATLLERPREELELGWVGLNHLGWLTHIVVDGTDRLPGLIDAIEEGSGGPANLPEIKYPTGFLNALGMIPSSYVRFFYMPGEMLKAITDMPETRAQQVMKLEEQLLEIYGDGHSDALPALLSERGGAWYSRLAVDVLEALSGVKPQRLIVNVPSNGSVGCVADDAVVEVPCWVDSTGAHPVDCNPIPEAISGLIAHVKSYERLAIEAALESDANKALLALVANPLVPNADVAAAVLNDMTTRGLVAPKERA